MASFLGDAPALCEISSQRAHEMNKRPLKYTSMWVGERETISTFESKESETKLK